MALANPPSQTDFGVMRRIEIIGEAARNIPQQIKDRYADIPWKRIAGMRDILIHQYYGVDLELTWRVAKVEVSEPKKRNRKTEVCCLETRNTPLFRLVSML